MPDEAQTSFRIPADWSFTPDQLTPLIAQRYPGARLSDVTLLEGSDGTSSRAKLGLRYAEGTGPAAVFAKTQGDIWHRLLHFMTGNLYREALLYGSGIELPIEHPAPICGLVDRARLNELVIMEDLTPRQPSLFDATRRIAPDDVAAGLRALAGLHSAFWNFTAASHPPLAWVETWRPSLRFRIILRGACRKGLANLRARVPDAIAALGATGLEQAWTRYIRTTAQGPLTLLHGDPHIGNSYRLPDGTFGFLDWACTRRGNWAFDVGYFLAGALSPDECRRHERDLVEEYRRALKVPETELPDTQQAWLRYRSTPAYGLAVWLATASSAEYQNHAICGNLIERYGRAFLDLDTPGAIADLEGTLRSAR